MSLIQINGLTFAYDGSFGNIFENVTLQIDTAWKLGLIGRNGRGKTTLLRLLAGGLEYRGRITASVGFDYFPYPVADNSRTPRQLVADRAPDCPGWQLERELNLLEVNLDTLDRPLETLSNGERTKILLASLFLRENRFLLIDEPTNHLDETGRERVARYLQSKQGFILVSHDRSFLDACVDHIMAINKTDIQIQKGNFTAWQENKRRQDEFELDRDAQLKREISQLKAAARETAERAQRFERAKIGRSSANIEKSIGKRAYMGEKSRKVMKQSKNLERRQSEALEAKTQLLGNLESIGDLKLNPLDHHARVLVRLNDISIQYGTKTACSHISLTLERGERVALRGSNGSGKSSILHLICGEPLQHSGEMYLAGGLIISYVPQDPSFLRGSLSAYARACGTDESLFRAILDKLDVGKAQLDKDLSDFSDGQKKKVLIARSLSERAHLYIWDEPLNYIDLFSRQQIEDLLLQYRPTLLLVEHDRAFLQRIVTKAIKL